MNIIYAVTTCSDKVYSRLFSQSYVKPAFQSQKYHRLLIEGLAANTRVDVVANPPVNRSVLLEKVVHLEEETEGGARYHYIHAYRNPFRKAFHVFFGTFLKTLRLADKESAVVVDCLNCVAGMAAQAAARLRGSRCVGIITDLPEMLGGSAITTRLINYTIRHCTDYVLLTEAMNDYIRNPGKPYVVLEGHADITMREKKPSMERKAPGRVILYAGSLSRRYGLGDLVEGFQLADLSDAELHIYGKGDYEEELLKIAAEDSRVKFGGMLMSWEVVEKEMEATLLVNPRPTREEFVKYSFPSKTMEYMSSGTPVLTTVLPGIPEEYYEHLYFIRQEDPEGIARVLKQVMAQADDALFAKGMGARAFVLEKRNNVVQAKKIVEMLSAKESG